VQYRLPGSGGVAYSLGWGAALGEVCPVMAHVDSLPLKYTNVDIPLR
jgi:hypothetical protein